MTVLGGYVLPGRDGLITHIGYYFDNDSFGSVGYTASDEKTRSCRKISAVVFTIATIEDVRYQYSGACSSGKIEGFLWDKNS